MKFVGTVDDREILDAMKRVQRLTGSAHGMLSAIGRYGVSSTRLRFRSQTDPDGVRWKPSKRALKHGGQTLRDKSILRNSITYNSDRNSVEWGTNIKHAAAHQFGVDKVVNVASHLRQATKRGQRPTGARGGGRRTPSASGKLHVVRAHARHMRLERRAFLGVNAADRLAILKIAIDAYDAAVFNRSRPL